MPPLALHTKAHGCRLQHKRLGARASRACAAESGHSTSARAPPSSSLAETVSSAFEAGEGHAYIYRDALLSPSLTYQNDFHTVSGQSQYLKAATAWFSRQKRLLPNVSSQIISVSQLSQDQLIVKWQVTWVRPAGFWLYQLGTSVPGLRLEYKDSLHKVGTPSKVSWDGIKRVLGRIVSEKVVEVPLAVVRGTSRLQFAADSSATDVDRSQGDSLPADATTSSSDRSSSGSSSSSDPNTSTGTTSSGSSDAGSRGMRLVRCVEQLELVPRFLSGEVQNRTITKDILLFQLVRQPPGRETAEWMAAVNERLVTSRVPGMGPLEVDGMGSEQQAQLYDDATSILAYVTFCVVLLGGMIAYTYFSRLTRF